MALRTRQTVLHLPMRVWDVPTRLFHWLLVVLLPADYVAAEAGWMHLHLQLGYALLALFLFRVVWGFIGSDTARFSRFLVNPLSALRYMARFGGREPDTQVGHNPAGGWMVLILLLFLGIQIGSGLSANDGLGAVEGPLAGYLSGHASDVLTAIHGYMVYVIIAAVGLHVVAIGAYAVVKGQDLIRPMITGKKRLPATTRAPRFASPLLALAAAALAAAASVLIATRV